MILYFTKLAKITRDQCEGWLPGRFPERWFQRAVISGIDGASGVVFCRDDKHVRFDKDTQVWHSMGMFPRKQGDESEMVELWCGWEKKNPPTPANLTRPNQLPGHTVKLQGDDWMIPMVREWSFDNGNCLHSIAVPRSAKYDSANRQWHAGEVVPECQRLFELTTDIYERYTKQTDDGGFDLPDDPISICTEFLAANYFLGMEEISALGLIQFSFECVWSILQLPMDLPGLAEVHQKKTESERS